MALITISRGSFSMGKAVAEKVAAKLKYSILSRDLLFKAGDRFHVPQKTLEKAIHDAPGIFERYSHTKKIFIAYIRATLIDMVAGGNIVYYGLAGHLLLGRLPCVLKVRIIANLEDRVAGRMAGGLSEQKARTMILADADQRRKWTKKIYNADPNDATLYDIVICIDKFSVDDAVDFICQSASRKAFEPTNDCIKQYRDLSLACNAKALLVESFPDVGVICEYGNLLVYATEKEAHTSKFKKIIETFQKENCDIYNLEVHTGLSIPANAV
ncbi:MAG: cytidylate kinase-like family protein [Deltaproteobacteria bacterium]|jgi:cytidylate kinase|nr:cytidylate kinase-like family protein [Deltaproteobacteria bacterium]